MPDPAELDGSESYTGTCNECWGLVTKLSLPRPSALTPSTTGECERDTDLVARAQDHDLDGVTRGVVGEESQ